MPCSKIVINHIAGRLKRTFIRNLLKTPPKVHLCHFDRQAAGDQYDFFECQEEEARDMILGQIFSLQEGRHKELDLSLYYGVPTSFTYDLDFATDWTQISKHICPLNPEKHVSQDEWKEQGILRGYFEQLRGRRNSA